MTSSSPSSTSQMVVKAPSLTSWNCYEKGLYKVLSSASSRPKSFVGGFATAGGLALLHFGVLSVAGAVAGALCLVPAIIWGSILVGYLPKPRGKHEVGSFDFEVKLPSMDDETETYALPVTIFFPEDPSTRSAVGRQRRDWLPSPQDEFIESFGSVYGIPAKVTKALLAPLRSMKMQAYGTEAMASGRWPVLLFSHGLYGTRTMYSAYCTEMASQGYVVLAPEHVDGTAAFVRSSSHALSFQKGPAVNRQKQLQQRVKELEAIWHHLRFLDETRFQPAGGSLDLSHCALTGHSFGGATSLLAAEAECFRGRCTVTMMDPWLEPAMQLLSGPGEVALAPTLTIMTASMLSDGNARCVVEVMARSKAAGHAAYMTELIGARHQDISDLPFFLHIPNGVLTASSMTRLGARIWRENADLVLHFLQARGVMSPDLDTKLRGVANVRIHDWKLWVEPPQTPSSGEQSH